MAGERVSQIPDPDMIPNHAPPVSKHTIRRIIKPEGSGPTIQTRTIKDFGGKILLIEPPRSNG